MKEEIVMEPDSGVSIEPDSGVSFELHDLQYESAATGTAHHGDDKKGSKVIVVAEVSETDSELLCDTSLCIKKSDSKKFESDSWKKSLSLQKKGSKKGKSTQDLMSSEDAEDGDSLNEAGGKDNECYWPEDTAQSEESLVEHFEHLFEAKPYHGVREWL